MPTAEEAAAANALYRAMNGLPADSVNTQIMSTPAGQSYQAQINAADAAAEQAKHDVAFSQPRNDSQVPQSAAFMAINSAYQQQQQNSIGSGGAYRQPTAAPAPTNPYDPNTAAGIAWDVNRGGGNVGASLQSKSISEGYSPQTYQLVSSNPNPRIVTQPEMSTVPIHDISSSAPTRAEALGYTNYEKMAMEAAPLRPGYYMDLGDSYTRGAVLASNMARAAGLNIASADAIQGRMLSAQRDAARSTSDSKDDRFYQNNLEKWAENKVELSSAYHHLGQKMDIPIPANRWEYAGDLAVEFLKGKPTKSSEWFSPVSGEMSKSLVGGEGLQQYAWNAAKNPVTTPFFSFGAGVEKLISAEGQYGPYGKLWGGPEYRGTPSSGTNVKSWEIPVAEGYVPFLGVVKSASVPSADTATPFISAGKSAPIPASEEPNGKDWIQASVLPTIGGLLAQTPIGKIVNNWSWESAPLEETTRNIAATTSRGTEGLLNTAAILPFASEAAVPLKESAPVATSLYGIAKAGFFGANTALLAGAVPVIGGSLIPSVKPSAQALFQAVGYGTDLTLGTVPAIFGKRFAPFEAQNAANGLGADRSILANANVEINAADRAAQNSWTQQDTLYSNYLTSKGEDLKARDLAFGAKVDALNAKGAKNTKDGYWTGDTASLDAFNKEVDATKAEGASLTKEFGIFSGETDALNKRAQASNVLYQNTEDVRKAQVASGAYVYRNGQLIENPDMKRSYGTFSDWGLGAEVALQKMAGINITPAQFANEDLRRNNLGEVKENPSYGILSGFVRGEQQKARNIDNDIYAFNKELFTNPEGLVASAISGAQIQVLTMGAGKILGGAAEGTGLLAKVAAPAVKLGDNPLMQYALPVAFVGSGVWDATKGFTLPAAQASMNVGQSGAHLAAMGAGAMAPEIPSLVSNTRVVNVRGPGESYTRGLNIGGDFVGYGRTPEGRLGVAMGGPDSLNVFTFGKGKSAGAPVETPRMSLGEATAAPVSPGKAMVFDVAEPLVKTPGVPKSSYDYLSGKMNEAYGTTEPSFVSDMTKQGVVTRAQERFIAGENLPTFGGKVTAPSTSDILSMPQSSWQDLIVKNPSAIKSLGGEDLYNIAIARGEARLDYMRGTPDAYKSNYMFGGAPTDYFNPQEFSFLKSGDYGKTVEAVGKGAAKVRKFGGMEDYWTQVTPSENVVLPKEGKKMYVTFNSLDAFTPESGAKLTGALKSQGFAGAFKVPSAGIDAMGRYEHIVMYEAKPGDLAIGENVARGLWGKNIGVSFGMDTGGKSSTELKVEAMRKQLAGRAQTQMLGGNWNTFVGEPLPVPGGKVGSGVMQHGKVITGNRAALESMSLPDAVEALKQRYAWQGVGEQAPLLNAYGGKTQVIFPGMKGGEHLKVGEAQLNAGELMLYKNVAVYKHHIESSVSSDVLGNMVDQATLGKATSTETLSKEFFGKYNIPSPFMRDGDEFFPTGKREQRALLYRDIKAGITHAHLHPDYMFAYKSGELGAGWGRDVPAKVMDIMDATMGRTASRPDIQVSAAYRPLQNNIINKYGATILEFPPELRHASEPYTELYDKTMNLFDSHAKLTNKILNESPISVSTPKEYRALTRNQKIDRARGGYQIEMAGFANFVTAADITTTLLSDINPMTGIGRVHGFSPDVLELASKRRAINGLWNINGKKMYEGDQLIVPTRALPPGASILMERKTVRSPTPTANMMPLYQIPGGFALMGKSGKGVKLVPFETFSPKEYLYEAPPRPMGPHQYGADIGYLTGSPHTPIEMGQGLLEKKPGENALRGVGYLTGSPHTPQELGQGLLVKTPSENVRGVGFLTGSPHTPYELAQGLSAMWGSGKTGGKISKNVGYLTGPKHTQYELGMGLLKREDVGNVAFENAGLTHPLHSPYELNQGLSIMWGRGGRYGMQRPIGQSLKVGPKHTAEELSQGLSNEWGTGAVVASTKSYGAPIAVAFDKANPLSLPTSKPTRGGIPRNPRDQWGGMKIVPEQIWTPGQYAGERNIPSMNPVYNNKLNYNDFVGRWAAKNIKEVAPVAVPYKVINLGTAYDVRTTKAVVPAFGDTLVSHERTIFNIGEGGQPKGVSSLEVMKVNQDRYMAGSGRDYIEGNGGAFGITKVEKVAKELHVYPSGKTIPVTYGKRAYVTSTSGITINPLFEAGLTSEISPARISMAEDVLREPAKRPIESKPKHTEQDLISTITDYTQMMQAPDITGVSRVLRAPESDRLAMTTGKSYELKFPGSSDINVYLQDPHMTREALGRDLLNVGVGTSTKVIGGGTPARTAENLFMIGNGPNERIGGLMFGDKQQAFAGMGDVLKASTIPKDTLEMRKIKADVAAKKRKVEPYFLGDETLEVRGVKNGRKSSSLPSLWKPKKATPIAAPKSKTGATAIQKSVGALEEKLGSISYAIEGALSSSLPAQRNAYDLSPISSFDASGMQGMGLKRKADPVEEEEQFVLYPQVPGMKRPSKSSGIESGQLFGETQKIGQEQGRKQGLTQKQKVEQERANAAKSQYGSLSDQMRGSLSIMGVTQSSKSIQDQARDQSRIPAFKLGVGIDLAQKIEPVTIRTLVPSVITDVGQVTGQKTGQVQGQKQGQAQEQKQVQPQIQKIEPVEPRPKPPKLPVIPIIKIPWAPSFGGGTSSVAPARGGKRYRETMDYAFSVGASARATSNLLRKGSNIGTGSNSLGLGTPTMGGNYKSVFGGGLSLPSINNKKGLPKSLSLGSSTPKKKGKKK